MDFDCKLSINILHKDSEISLELPQNNTIWDLKLEIFEKLNIPPSKQIIDCWHQSPEDDNDTLGKCCESSPSYLVVCNADDRTGNEEDKSEDVEVTGNEDANDFRELETRAAMDFIEYFSKNFDDRGILFYVCGLEDAMSQACFTTLDSRKILLLYLHNKNDKFAKIFGENLITPEVKEIVNNKYFLLGWDLEKEIYHPALIKALSSRAELSALVNFVESKVCAALLIVPIKNSFTLFSCIKSKVSKKDFLETLKKAQDFLLVENGIQKDLEETEQISDNDIGSTKYQQIMLDRLGDRDYDSFDHFEFNYLKDKIGYALYGPPGDLSGYNEKQKKKIAFLFDAIVKQNNIFAKWKDRVVISFIYNCIEPLPSEKQRRSEKYKEYNPNTDLTPIPIFVLRKCKTSKNPCRVIIDDTGRVYKTWSSYLTENKLSKCEMVLPLNGRYQADENGNVILERHLSPACGIDTKILQGADIANAAAGLVSGGIMIAATIPTITVAPLALMMAGATGIGVGLYSLGRSAYTLYDRSKHEETLSFASSEARGAYLNIVAGSLGFVGAGANMAVSQLVARGFNINKGASAVVNVINVANVSASGINVVNCSYDVFDQWFNENKVPSLLSVVQLSSSILFFGHAVYNFKSAGTIIEESQARTLQEYNDSFGSNRYRKTFNKMMRQVAKGKAEVIKRISNIQKKGFAALMDNSEAAFFLEAPSNTPEPSQNEVNMMSSQLQVSFSGMIPGCLPELALHLLRIFANTENSIKEKIINSVVCVVRNLLSYKPDWMRKLENMFPGCDKYLRLINMVGGYFQNLINQVEEKYQKWLATKDPYYKEPIFAKLALNYSKRAVELFNFVSRAYFVGTNLTEAGLRELIEYFYTWFAKKVDEYKEYVQRKQKRALHSGLPAKRSYCRDCGGLYYY